MDNSPLKKERISSMIAGRSPPKTVLCLISLWSQMPASIKYRNVVLNSKMRTRAGFRPNAMWQSRFGQDPSVFRFLLQRESDIEKKGKKKAASCGERS